MGTESINHMQLPATGRSNAVSTKIHVNVPAGIIIIIIIIFQNIFQKKLEFHFCMQWRKKDSELTLK